MVLRVQQLGVQLRPTKFRVGVQLQSSGVRQVANPPHGAARTLRPLSFLFLRFCFGPFWVGHLHAAPWVAAAALRAACTSSWCCWWLGLQLQQFVVMLLILARAFCLILALLCQQGAILVVPPVAVAIPLVPICQGVCGTHPQVDPFVKG